MYKYKKAHVTAFNRNDIHDIIRETVDHEVSKYIFANFKVKKRRCICGCNRIIINPRSKYHHFYSRKCYAKYHRLPGFVKRIVDHKD